MNVRNPITDRALLRNVPLLSVLTDEQLETLARVVMRKTVARNREVVTEGDKTQSLFIILSGRAKVQISDAEGREVILAVLGPGEYFGELALLDDEPRSASVVSIESCEFLTISKDDFVRCINQNAEMSMLMMRGLVKRLRDADRKIESLALFDVYGRVAHVLLDFSEEVNGQRVVTKKLPRQDIAKMIGASREMVSRVMKGLETQGLIIPMEDGTLQLRENFSNRI